MKQLVGDLEDALCGNSRGVEVAGLLEGYAREHGDWRDFAHFREEGYTRNLVSGGDEFELLVICWHPGQVSPIHDHQGQRCWMAVLDGEMRERHYHAPAPGERGLRRGPERVFPAGAVAYISDEIALHDIAPLGETPAVTLHLYARPIRECRIFDPESGEETLRGLVYHSIDGVLHAGEPS